MKTLELKIPPPAVALAFALLMWLVARSTQTLQAQFPVRAGAGILFLLVGQGISISGMRAFRRARTTINPFKPRATSALVSDGVYRFTRNPMYVGLLITLVGWAAFLASPMSLLLLPLFVWYVHHFQIKPEERVLSSIFGAEYEAYKAKVRRWL